MQYLFTELIHPTNGHESHAMPGTAQGAGKAGLDQVIGGWGSRATLGTENKQVTNRNNVMKP